MNKFKYIIMVLSLLPAFSIAQVQVNVQPEKPNYPLVNWTSKSSSETVTVENGTGALISILIVVNKDDKYPNAIGVNVKNCGATTHINVGSSAVCYTNDPVNPVSFESDTGNPVSGTYQIKNP